MQPERPRDLSVPPDIAERVNRFETGRNGADDTLYRAATDRTILVGVINRLNALHTARSSPNRNPDGSCQASIDYICECKTVRDCYTVPRPKESA